MVTVHRVRFRHPVGNFKNWNHNWLADEDGQFVCLFLCLFVGWLLACLTSQQHASVSQGRICSNNCTCCHIEREFANQTLYLTQSQYPNTGRTSISADRITPGAWQGDHWSANFWVTGMTRPGKIPASLGIEPLVCRSRGGRLNHKANEAVFALSLAFVYKGVDDVRAIYSKSFFFYRLGIIV